MIMGSFCLAGDIQSLYCSEERTLQQRDPNIQYLPCARELFKV
ncbi:MAG: hypothetical protein QOG91_536 [Candidatus Parcubacteria bacterium]|jgi:hypothetical protein|nr:hypothetical protein [Candidatus Parcubacteria bacterium]